MQRILFLAQLCILLLSACSGREEGAGQDIYMQPEQLRQEWKKPEILPGAVAPHLMLRPEDQAILGKTYYYKTTWMGIHVGDLFATMDYQNGLYTVHVVTRSYGPAQWISKYYGDTISAFFYDGKQYRPQRFRSQYRIRNKVRTLSVRYDMAGNVTEDQNIPEEDPKKRPPVSAALKKNSYDSLSLALELRRRVRAAGTEGKGKTFTLPLYSGRSLVNMLVTPEGLAEDGTQIVSLKRDPVAGLTQKELKNHAERDITLRLWLDPKTLMPVRGEGVSSVGTATLEYQGICESVHQCTDSGESTD
ncbi:MAG: DUF3108 domain-containing protein [Hyphomicrobiales bacterium]|nr:DUF3108 domain-containing protein [Rickettsiales bacterium]MCP5361380.1 DUF3108 domain-containing protein [Hyphomicrobiales bacterium]